MHLRKQDGFGHCRLQQEKSDEISNKVTGCGHTQAAENLVDIPSENLEKLDGTSGTDGTIGANETNEMTVNEYD